MGGSELVGSGEHQSIGGKGSGEGGVEGGRGRCEVLMERGEKKTPRPGHQKIIQLANSTN